MDPTIAPPIEEAVLVRGQGQDLAFAPPNLLSDQGLIDAAVTPSIVEGLAERAQCMNRPRARRDLAPAQRLIDPLIAPGIEQDPPVRTETQHPVFPIGNLYVRHRVINLAVPAAIVHAPLMETEGEDEATPTGHLAKLTALHAAHAVHDRNHQSLLPPPEGLNATESRLHCCQSLCVIAVPSERAWSRARPSGRRKAASSASRARRDPTMKTPWRGLAKKRGGPLNKPPPPPPQRHPRHDLWPGTRNPEPCKEEEPHTEGRAAGEDDRPHPVAEKEASTQDRAQDPGEHKRGQHAPRCRRVGPEDRLHKERNKGDGPKHRHPGHEAGHEGGEEDPVLEETQGDQGVLRAALDPPKNDHADQRNSHQAEPPLTPPAGPHDAQKEKDQGNDQDCSPKEINRHRPRRLAPWFSERPANHIGGDKPHRDVDKEYPPPREVIRKKSPKEGARDAGHPPYAAEKALQPGARLKGVDVADDGEPQGKNGTSPETLYSPKEDELRHGARKTAGDGPQQEESDAEKVEGAAAVEIREFPPQGDGDGGREQVT